MVPPVRPLRNQVEEWLEVGRCRLLARWAGAVEKVDRGHPRRLPAESYRVPGEVVFVTMVARRNVCLVDGETPSRVLAAMHSAASRYGVRLHAYCLMPSHLHVICSGAPGCDVALWLRRFKGGAARRVGGPLWQRSYWDRHARESDDAVAMMLYTLENPVRRGLCKEWTDWPWSWSEWHQAGG